MATSNKVPSSSGVRFTPDDRRIIAALQKKLGVGMVQIVRMGIRVLAAKEGLAA